MLNVIYANGQAEEYNVQWVTDRIRETGFWDNSTAQTPEKTVHKNFSQSKDVFGWVRPNVYRLKPAYFRVPDALAAVVNPDVIVPPDLIKTPIYSSPEANAPVKRVKHTIYRALRDSTLVRQLKILHKHQCQICGTSLDVPTGKYSEGHHIKPIGLNGPDVAENIIVLCPNHHVQCDYGSIAIDIDSIRIDPLHRISREFVDWHNSHYGFTNAE